MDVDGWQTRLAAILICLYLDVKGDRFATSIEEGDVQVFSVTRSAYKTVKILNDMGY